MPRPRKGQERTVTGVYRRTYTDKDGKVREYWQYIVYVRDENGKPKPDWRSAPTKKAAEEARAERKADVRRGEAVQASKLTLAAYLWDWLEKHRVKNQLEPTTVEGYKIIIRTRIVPALGGIPLQQLSEQHIEKLLYDLQIRGGAQGKPLSARSVRHTLVLLNDALKQAKRLKLIARNPCAEIEPPKIESQQQPQWTPEEAKRFLALLDREYFGALYILTLTTGLRRSEVLGLRWQDVDLDEGMLHVRQKLTQVNGALVFGNKMKTPSGRRDIPLHPQVVERLREHRKQQLTLRMAAGPRWVGAGEGGELVFCTREGKPLTPRNIYRRLNQLIARLGISRAMLHGMRRTASSIAHDETKDLLAVARLLGHAQPDVTAKHYARASEEATKLAAQAVGRAYFGS
jgi:integrase